MQQQQSATFPQFFGTNHHLLHPTTTTATMGGTSQKEEEEKDKANTHPKKNRASSSSSSSSHSSDTLAHSPRSGNRRRTATTTTTTASASSPVPNKNKSSKSTGSSRSHPTAAATPSSSFLAVFDHGTPGSTSTSPPVSSTSKSSPLHNSQHNNTTHQHHLNSPATAAAWLSPTAHSSSLLFADAMSSPFLDAAEFDFLSPTSSTAVNNNNNNNNNTINNAVSSSSSSSKNKSKKTTTAQPRATPTRGGRKKNGKWLAKLEELKTYKLQYGDCVVPRGYPENPHLATWVAEQRKQYKLLRDGRPSNISQERIDLLNDLDFTWNAQEAAWDRSFQVLKTFQQKHGHCHVPNNQPQYRKLGLWVKEQRRHYSLLRQGKPSQMTQERCKILNSVGFCWNTSEATWLERLKQLTAYQNEYGDCNVPKGFEENPELSNFVQNQRKQFKQYVKGENSGGMTRERIHALQQIGFNWGISGAEVTAALSDIESTMAMSEAIPAPRAVSLEDSKPSPRNNNNSSSFVLPPPPPPASFQQPSLSFEEHEPQDSTSIIDTYYAGAAAAAAAAAAKGQSESYGDNSAVGNSSGNDNAYSAMDAAALANSVGNVGVDDNETANDVNHAVDSLDLDDAYFSSSGGALNVHNVVAL